MNTSKNLTAKNYSPQEPYRFTKRHGSTVYEVYAHFNQSAKETMDSKILRLIHNEVLSGKAAV